MKLTEREIHLLDGIIKAHQRHADICIQTIDNQGEDSTMSSRQLVWDNERIDLLTRILKELS